MADTGKPYPIGAGIFSSPRLDLQYAQTIQTFGGHLIDPIIPHSNPNLKIADVCCGTGYFLVNLEADPSTEYHALDIDLSRLPPEAFFPNLQRHKWNINDPPPTDLVSKFDIVNVQFLWAFTPDVNVDKVLTNILSLVKPGGYIQWTESCVAYPETISPDPAYTPQFLPHVFNMAFELYHSPMPTWPRILDEVFTRNGAVQVLKTERTNLQPRQYRAWTLQQSTVFEEILAYMRTTVDGEVRKAKVDEFAELVQNSHWEAQVKWCAHILPFVRVVGRRSEGEAR